MSEKPLAERLCAAAETVIAAGFSGVVSVRRDSQELLLQASGYADRANDLAITPRTRFGIASGTKFFTALGIARLVEAGRLSFDDAVVDLLPARLPGMAREVTVAHLLTHTSGFWDYYDEEEHPDSEEFFVSIPWYRLDTPTDYLPLFHDAGMVGVAGERVVYNNGAFVLLGAVIEAVTGELYRDFVEREVLARAGMARSGFFAFNQLPAETAHGYMALDGGGWKTNIYNLPIRGGGDGGLYTTAGDLDHLWEALFARRVLGEPITAAVLQPRVDFNATIRYGYGVYIGPEPSYFIVGGDAGVGFYARFYPEQRLSVTVLSNATDGEAAMRNAVLGLCAPRA